MAFFRQELAIDLGTANTVVFKDDKVILDEPSIIAIDTHAEKRIALGNEAQLMEEQTPPGITTIRPMMNGVIADYDAAELMLTGFIEKATGRRKSIFGPSIRMVIGIPGGSTPVDKRSIRDSAAHAGAADLKMIYEPMAAALGIGLDVTAPNGNMIVDIGGGTTEVAVLSLGGIVLSKSLRTAGVELDEAITSYIKRKYNILIGETTAELLKKRIGSAHPATDRGAMEVRGRNLLSGLPAVVTIRSGEVREAMQNEVQQIVEVIRNTLENTPPELASDIYDTGIMLSGGGALLAGIDLLISRVTGIRTVVAKNPIDCVAVGIGRYIENGETGGLSYRNR